jgi:hypothetical protein
MPGVAPVQLASSARRAGAWDGGQGHLASPPIDEREPLTRLGACLYSAFTADNHDSLDEAVTRSLLHLSCEAKTGSKRSRPGSDR